jgi:hypothetical protein
MCSGVIWSKMAVFTAAGVTQFTRTPVSASSLPSDLVKPMTRGLAGAVGAGVGVAVLAGHRGDVDDAAVALLAHLPPPPRGSTGTRR